MKDFEGRFASFNARVSCEKVNRRKVVLVGIPGLLEATLFVTPSLLSRVVVLSSIWSSPRFLSRKFSREAVLLRLGRTGALDRRATLMYLDKKIRTGFQNQENMKA